MSNKQIIVYLLQSPILRENIQYQKIRKVYWSDIEVHQVMIKDQTTFFELQISFLWDVKDFGKYKDAIDFGQITIKKYGGKVDHQLIVTGFVRVRKSDCEDFLHSQGCDKGEREESGSITQFPPWLLKRQESSYEKNITT